MHQPMLAAVFTICSLSTSAANACTQEEYYQAWKSITDQSREIDEKKIIEKKHSRSVRQSNGTYKVYQNLAWCRLQRKDIDLRKQIVDLNDKNYSCMLDWQREDIEDDKDSARSAIRIYHMWNCSETENNRFVRQ